MISVERFIEPINYNHWGHPPLSGYIYKNILDIALFQNLKKEIENIINTESKATFLTNTTIIHDGGKTIKLGVNYANDRYQNVLFDLTFNDEYWYQTESTISKWVDKILKTNCSPKILKFLDAMTKVEPFNDARWVPYRLHLNYLPHNNGLPLHLDSNPLIFNEVETARALSLTYYMHNHKTDLGGELFTINGWSFDPKENTAIAINGHQVLHGVTYNNNTESRLAFTVRWAHIDDLFLPGHPSKHLYKMDHL